MNSLLSAILITVMALNNFSSIQAAVERNITVNQVVQAVFESRKLAIIKSVNKRLQNQDIYRGAFFKGEIPEVKKILDKLLQTNPRVVESPRGFTIIAGKGESQVKVEMEFVDILTGKFRIAGESIQLNKDMSYLELNEAMGKPVLQPIFEKLKKQILQKTGKTGFSNLLDSFIPLARGEEEEENAYGVSKFEGAMGIIAGLGTTTLLMVGLKFLLGLFLTGTPLGWALLASGVIVTILGSIVGEAVMIDLSRLISGQDELDIGKAQLHFHEILLSCQADKQRYFGKSSSLNKKKIARLKKDNPEQFADFQQLWLLSRKVRDLQGYLKKKNSDREKLVTLGCHQLGEKNKSLKKYFFTHVSGLSGMYLSHTPSELIFLDRLRPLCKIYGQIIHCFADSPRPFGERVSVKEEAAIIKSNRPVGNSKYGAFYESLRKIEGVLDEESVYWKRGIK